MPLGSALPSLEGCIERREHATLLVLERLEERVPQAGERHVQDISEPPRVQAHDDDTAA